MARRALLSLLLDDEKRQALAAEWGHSMQDAACFNVALHMNPRVEQLAFFTQVSLYLEIYVILGHYHFMSMFSGALAIY